MLNLTFPERCLLETLRDCIEKVSVELYRINQNPYRNEHLQHVTCEYGIAYFRSHLEAGVMPAEAMKLPDYDEDWPDYVSILHEIKAVSKK